MIPSALSSHLKRHKGSYLLIGLTLFFSLASYKLYFDYISTEKTRSLFLIFYLVCLFALLTLIVFTFVSKSRLKEEHFRSIRIFKYVASVIVLLALTTATFLTGLVAQRVVVFFERVFDNLSVWLRIALSSGDVSSLTKMTKEEATLLIGLTMSLVLFVSLIIVSFELFKPEEVKVVRLQERLKEVSKGEEPRYQGYRRLAFGFLYKYKP